MLRVQIIFRARVFVYGMTLRVCAHRRAIFQFQRWKECVRDAQTVFASVYFWEKQNKPIENHLGCIFSLDGRTTIVSTKTKCKYPT
jgi:hypothetical protein